MGTECEMITKEDYDRMVEEDLTIEAYGIGITAEDANLLAEIAECLILAKQQKQLTEGLCYGDIDCEIEELNDYP